MLQNMRLRHAQQLLTQASQKIRTIACACGLRDDKYFIRAFRRQTGLTLGQYRQMARRGSPASAKTQAN